MDYPDKKSLWIWETGEDEIAESWREDRQESGKAISLKRTPALQLEELRIRRFAMGKSCAVIASEEHRLYEIGSPGVETLTLNGIETTLHEVLLLKSHHVTEVACGYHHTAVLVKSGAAFCWGLSSFGQCGVVTDLVSKPSLVKCQSNKHIRLKKVTCGKYHTMAISHDRELWGWGMSGMIAGPTTTHRNTPCPVPQLVEGLCGRKVLQVSCGKYHTVALTEKLPKAGSSMKPETSEICEICHQEIYKWEDSELIMQDNGDQVIITDTHACPHKIMQKSAMDSKSVMSLRVKLPTHARSMSLPFFRRTGSPVLPKSDKPDKLSKTPPTPQEIPLHLFSSNQKYSSENDISKEPETLQTAWHGSAHPRLSQSAVDFPETKEEDIFASDLARDIEQQVSTVDCAHKRADQKNFSPVQNGSLVTHSRTETSSGPDATSAAGRGLFRLPKSCSVPVDLWKEEKKVKNTFLFGSELDSQVPVFPTTPGSSSASLTSLDDCKSRMTLPVQSEEQMNLDPESALSYLKQLSPVTSENELNHATDPALSPTEMLRNGEIPSNEKSMGHGARELKQSISERISKTITDNQLLSPLTSYSKNVFTGVMDHIEWIKTSTYDKGVAPIRELWTRDRSTKKEEEQNEDGFGQGLPSGSKPEEAFQFTSDHAAGPQKTDPLLDDSPNHESNPTPPETEEALTLHTEVWSWGENKHGVLGLSDDLDRLQPAPVNTLSLRGIVKVMCGAHHSVALTSNAEVYTWGSNLHGQLGHEKVGCHSPEKLQCKNRIWDVAAGSYHTLVLADGVSQKPNLLLCGSGKSEKSSSAHPLQLQGQKKHAKDWRLRPIDFSHKMGFQSMVVSGFSTLSSCLTADNCSSFTLALYDFAKAEREFYQHVTLIKTDVLRPFKFSDLYKLLEHTPYCDIISQATELFGTLCYDIGLNTVHLTRAIVTSEVQHADVFSYVGKALVESYSRYFEALNDMIAYGFFEKCEAHSSKRSKFLSDPKLITVFKKLLGDRRLSKLPSENFLQTLQYPAFRLREYASTLSKLSVSAEEDASLSKNLEKLSSRWDALWTKLNNQLHSANQTRGFWKNEFKSTSGAKLAETLKSVGRYLVIHSKKVPMDVAHSGRFSYNWFILFTDCLVVVHYGTHFLHPLELLWCTPSSEGKDKSRTIKMTVPEDEIVAVAGTEESKSTWLNSLYRAINVVVTKERDGRRELRQLESSSNVNLHRSPSQSRHAAYTFTKDPQLKGCRYTGAWLNGKPHGRGEMTWEDGRSYKGNYKNGVEDSFGEWKAAPSNSSKLKYRGWWKEGKMDGYGKLWYSRYQSYEGHFVAGLREGHGVLRTGSVTEGSVYIGGWHKDQRRGFGVEDNITRGEKYLGMWSNDQRHGVGILVTLDSLYCQARFQNGEVGGDALLVEGRYAFEGQVSAGMVLCGKGRLTMPAGDKLEGSFTGPWGENIRVAGNLIRSEVGRTLSIPDSPKTPLDHMPTFNHPTLKDNVHTILRRYNRHIMRKLVETKGGRSFPLSLHPDSKWKEVFAHTRASIACPHEDTDDVVDLRKVWEAVPVAISIARQKREHFKPVKSSPSKIDEVKLGWLERVPSVVKLTDGGAEAESEMRLSQSDVACIQEYLNQSFSTTLHPLGELAEAIGNVFRDSYSGAGAHKWLLTQAVADIRSFVRRSYEIVSCMFPQLLKQQEESSSHLSHPSTHPVSDGKNSRLRSHSEDTPTQITAGDLMLPVLLPRLYPTLFTLYALRHENEDRSYWERVTRLNRHPDVALLSFLGVKPKFWLLDEKEIPPLETSPDDGQLYENEERAESSKWRHLLVARARDCTFLTAVETLQLISTTFIPAEKLNVIHSTFKEINSSVTKYLHSSHTWSMDDLFPVFQYVVVRARISHLGCEIQLIEDFLEPDMCKGEKGIMFTTLKACYFQIRVEKDL